MASQEPIDNFRIELRASAILDALVTLVMDADNASSRSYFQFDIFNELNELFVDSSTLPSLLSRASRASTSLL